MKKDPVEYLEQMANEFGDFRGVLATESDRGCALFAGAYLEAAIGDLIMLCLVRNDKIKAELLTGTSPLSTFSARISMAYYLGQLSRKARLELDIIRKVRNEFAHSSVGLTFETKEIADRCRALKYSYHQAKASPRQHFTASVSAIAAQVHAAAFSVVPPEEKKDDCPTEEMKEANRGRIKAMLEAAKACCNE